MASGEAALAQRLAEGLVALGKPGFRAGQEEAVRAALAQQDALVVLPTGGGKSLCYMLAAQLQKGLCVVVSPLRALMKDQVDNAPLPVAALTSDTGEGLKERLYAQLEGKVPLGIKCLLVSPEMLHTNQRLVNALTRLARRKELSLVAIDEAHCVVDWGTSFRPAYTRLKAIIDRLVPRPPVMALTASAGEKGRAAIATALGLRQHRLVMTSFDRKNIRYEVRYPDSYDNPGWQSRDLLALLRGPDALGAPLRCGVVYCRAKGECDEAAALINRARIPGITAAAYHAGIGDKARRTVQADWRAGRITLAVATVAFGMGIDKADVRLVVHMQPPMTMTGWYQESGRAGRDGLPALAVMYYTAAEERKGLFLSRKPPQDAAGKPPDARAKQALEASKAEFEAVCDACRTPTCLRAALVAHFGEKLPRGACTAPGSAGCTACSGRRAMEAAIVAMASSTGSKDSAALQIVRAAIAQGPAAMRDLELDEFRFGLPSDDEDSDGRGDWPDEDAVDPVAEIAADVALAAHAGGGDAEECCGRAVDALIEEEAKHAAACPSNGRSGLGGSLFGHRKPVAAAPKPAPRPAPAPRACGVDAAMREATRDKLAAAMRGDTVAAAKAEAAVFADCRGVVAIYNRAAREAILDAERAAQRPAAGAPQQPAGSFRAPLMLSVRPGAFVPPRAAPPPQPAEAPQQPKLKRTPFGLPLPSEALASKQAKTS